MITGSHVSQHIAENLSPGYFCGIIFSCQTSVYLPLFHGVLKNSIHNFIMFFPLVNPSRKKQEKNSRRQAPA